MTTFHRLLIGAMLGGMIAAGIALATPATVTGQAHPEVVQARAYAPGVDRVRWIGADGCGMYGYDDVAERCRDHVQPQEDESGWDCATMGNRHCDALPLGTEVTVAGKPWAVTVTGLEPVGTN